MLSLAATVITGMVSIVFLATSCAGAADQRDQDVQHQGGSGRSGLCAPVAE